MEKVIAVGILILAAFTAVVAFVPDLRLYIN